MDNPYMVVKSDFKYIFVFIRYSRLLFIAMSCLLSTYAFSWADTVDQVGKYQIYEIQLNLDEQVDNPFNTYLLEIELESPNGRKFVVDGFYDGDGAGGQNGNVWKARICPDELGMWKWKAIENNDRQAPLLGLKGQFKCIESNYPGGLVADKQFFRFKHGGPIFLQGNFLDFAEGSPSTHVFMSEKISDLDRAKILKRQRDYHKANKINIYIANKGDYNGISTIPWAKNKSGFDLSIMDIATWTRFDKDIMEIKKSGMFAELWFFADDSGFGKLDQEDKNRLFRYAMARTSAFSNTLFIIALEWQEGWSRVSLRESGRYLQGHNPWGRMISVHSIPSMAPDSIRSFLSIIYKKIFKGIKYSDETWADFIASQAGNDAIPKEVNSLAVDISRTETIPHISEEFGELRKNGDLRLMRNVWANFCGGAAGGGTGDYIASFMRFLQLSRIPFQRMKPMNELLKHGGETAFCLAELGHHYLVYCQGREIQINVRGDGLIGYWYKPTNSNASLQGPFLVQAGTRRFQAPESLDDWVLWITDGSNLNSVRLYPPDGGVVVKSNNKTKKVRLAE